MNATLPADVLTLPNDTACACAICTSYCRNNPGWMLPEEAARAIAAGYADRLMLDWWEASKETDFQKVYLLCPASAGSQGAYAPDTDFLSILRGWSKGQCTLLEGDTCAIHASGFKPLECRAAHHDGTREASYRVRVALVCAWNTPAGEQIVAVWRVAVGLHA
jgi:Fe-S-cluster containining protein